MPRVVFDPSVSSIVVDLLLEAADGRSSLVIPVVLDTGASLTILATDIMARMGYDPANPDLERQRIITGRGIEYAPRTTVRSATNAFAKADGELELSEKVESEKAIDTGPVDPGGLEQTSLACSGTRW
jgi:hypothetical protein